MALLLLRSILKKYNLKLRTLVLNLYPSEQEASSLVYRCAIVQI